MMASIRAGLEVAFHVEHSRPMARGKLVDLALVVGTAVLVLGMAGLTLLDRLAQHTLRRMDSATGLQETQLGTIIPRTVAVALSVGIVMLLYRFVPGRRLRLRDALAGAITTAILLLVISFASSRVLRQRDAPQHRVRIAHSRAGLPVLRLPVRLRTALRRSGRCNVVDPGGSRRGAGHHPDQARALGARQDTER